MSIIIVKIPVNYCKCMPFKLLKAFLTNNFFASVDTKDFGYIATVQLDTHMQQKHVCLTDYPKAHLETCECL